MLHQRRLVIYSFPSSEITSNLFWTGIFGTAAPFGELVGGPEGAEVVAGPVEGIDGGGRVEGSLAILWLAIRKRTVCWSSANIAWPPNLMPLFDHKCFLSWAAGAALRGPALREIWLLLDSE